MTTAETQTWRVVCEGGEVREVTPQPCPQADGTMRWSVDGAGSHSTQRGAVLAACMRGVDVVEIVAPGAQTSDERLAQVTAERNAAVAARDALAGAAAAVRDARAAASAAGARYIAAWDTVVAMPPTALQSEGISAALRVSYEAQDALGAALDTLLSGTPVAMVRAEVVRAYLDAREAVPEDFDGDHAGADERARAYALWDAVEAARTALDAALAAAGGV